MKVIIIPTNTDLNRGDQALVWESIRLIEDVYGKNNVECILMADLKSSDAELQTCQTKKLGYRLIETTLQHPGRKFSHNEKDSRNYTVLTIFQWGSQAVLDYLRSRPLMSKFKTIRMFGEIIQRKGCKQTIQEIKDADAIFVKGGGFIHSYGALTDPYFIYYLTNTIRIAQAYGKKVIMLPNSIGPLNNFIARHIAKGTLNKCSMVTVRENLSKQCLASIGIDSFLYPDLGFFLNPSNVSFNDYLKRKGVPLEHKKVVLTLRPYRFHGFSDSKVLFSNYIDGISKLVQHVICKGYHVTFMAHTLGPSTHEDDRIAIKDVVEHLPAEMISNISYIEDFSLTCSDVEKIYSYYDYMIGTRFHSVIFSLNVGVPSIAISYGGNKGKGIMNVLGNDDFSIDMDKIYNNSLIDIFEKLECNRELYLKKMSISRNKINYSRKELILKIREVLELR